MRRTAAWLAGAMVTTTAAALAPAPAAAEWLKASSRHFTIYADVREAELRNLATRLETFDAGLRILHGQSGDDGAVRPVTVYVLDDVAAVERLCRCPNVAGFYTPRADGAVIFTPRRGSGDGVTGLKAQTVLFHEYAHHFLLGGAHVAYPSWYSEGHAELVSTAQVTSEFVQFGGAANHRAYGLTAEAPLPLAKLLAPPARMSDTETEQLYGRGWLLTHYVSFNAERRAQFQRYAVAFASGTPPLKAAADAFGDLKQLDRELDRYLRGRTIPGYRLAAANLPTPAISIRPLTPGERALVDHRIQSTRGVDDKTAAPLYARAKRAGAPADDAVAQGWLAEMAYDAGQDAEAEAAADRALAADPRSIQALLYKARVRLRRAAAAGATDPKIWSEARSWIVRANRIDPDHAGALELFHDSFVMAGQQPNASAVKGLVYALAVAPYDPDLRWTVVPQHLLDGRTAEARRALMPLAYSPHAAPDNAGVKLLALLDAGQAGPAALAALEAQQKAEAEKAGAKRKD